MELFCRILLILTVPAFQLMMVVWRVQQKIRVPIIGTTILCFVLSFLSVSTAASIFPDSLSPCFGCSGGKSALDVLIIGLFINFFLNIVFSLLGIIQYKAALGRGPE